MTLERVKNVHVVNNLALAKLTQEEIAAHFGEYAIMVDGDVVSYHSTNREAIKVAAQTYKIGSFSVQRIEPQPVDMGFADCADYPG